MGTSGRRAGKQLGTPQTDLQAAQREATAFEMRAEGKTFAQIAEALGYESNGHPNESAAYKAYRRALARIPRESVDEMRENILAEQAMMKQAMLRRMKNGDVYAAREFTAMHDRQAKLFGLDKLPDDLAAAAHYVKRIIIEEETRPNLPPRDVRQIAAPEGEQE